MVIIDERPQEKSAAPLAPESLFAVSSQSQAETFAAVENSVDSSSYAPTSTQDADTLPPAYDTLIVAGPSRSAPTQDLTAGSSRDVSVQKSEPVTHPIHLYYPSSDQSLTNAKPSPSPSSSSPPHKLVSSEQPALILPPSFSRSPPTSHLYSSFSSMSLEVNGADLDSGFPETLPPSLENPHPFISHDVTGSDWRR